MLLSGNVKKRRLIISFAGGLRSSGAIEGPVCELRKWFYLMFDASMVIFGSCLAMIVLCFVHVWLCLVRVLLCMVMLG